MHPWMRCTTGVAGFIVLADGRAYAAANWATDAAVRAIAIEIDDEPLRQWVAAQQSEFVGMGMTNVDLREIAPQYHSALHAAIRAAYGRACRDGFEQLDQQNTFTDGWLKRFGELVEMLDRSEAGEPPELFNPHLRETIPATGRRVGPGWEGLRDLPHQPNRPPGT